MWLRQLDDEEQAVAVAAREMERRKAMLANLTAEREHLRLASEARAAYDVLVQESDLHTKPETGGD